ncbi:MAG: sulfatase-like hydrolase/transferase [Acidobacteria bacterium]|jgi:arylsulfatase A-like enzyme/Tfp pilus assembly protein PilF|nr:sulfatase-like hydrolase/transferase [Acidobacteriota bacterium]
MRRRACLFFLLAASALAAGSSGPVSSGAGPTHVLLVTIDTLRYDRISALDPRHVRTPNIDALAARSLVFRRAFAHNPVTLPSHANILTGATPLLHGVSDNTGFKLDRKFLTIPEYLHLHGYRTAAFVGAFPLDSRFGLDQGFDLYDDYYGTRNEREFFFVERPAARVVAPAKAWIGKQKGKWFAWVHLFDPHQPYLPPSPYKERYPDDPYSGEVAYVDAQLGVLFDHLRDRGLLERTLVVLTADHGEALGEKGEETHSYFAYNNTIHVPLLIHVPGRRPAVSDLNACHADIFPTVCAALGLPVPAGLQGESLLGVLAGGRRQAPGIYFESLTAHLNRGWAPLRGMISGSTKFIDLPLKEVYDLEKDYAEELNLAASSRIGPLQDSLNRLVRKLKNPQAPGRAARLDPEVQKRLRSLGYISESRPQERRKTYTEKDDLKTLLPLQNKMLASVGRYQAGDAPGAEKGLREVIAASPGFILAYNHLATMFKEAGQPARAVAILEQGLQRNPGDIRLLSRLGIILADSGEWRRAVPILESCVRQEDFDPENFNFLGIAHYQGGDMAKALQNYARALELDHNYASVHNNIGSVHLRLFLGNNDRQAFALAERHFKQALEIDPRLFAACNGLAAAYKKVGRNPEAIRYWRQALAIKPDYDLALVNLGITLLEEGSAAEALRLFLRYRELFAPRLPTGERQRIERLIAEARAKQ